ncbi:hypothetical protein BK703_16450 [Bacillus thuringiensis serovar silo]|nr:hypothetical protein BK703_16450 [Bacillus thuringiensis serovar silo]OTW70659.1 hypothetical protein BK700_06040 [Bacillus thuringiensis serovar toguchini]
MNYKNYSELLKLQPYFVSRFMFFQTLQQNLLNNKVIFLIARFNSFKKRQDFQWPLQILSFFAPEPDDELTKYIEYTVPIKGIA